jgi:pilus assembly protein CpaB
VAKFSAKGLLCIALALSFIFALLLWRYLDNVKQSAMVQVQAQVVVAKVEIPPNALITADMIETIPVRNEQVRPGAKTSPDGVVGVYSKERIPAQEQITDRLIFGEGKSARFTGAIPAGKRAVSLAVNDVTGVGGLIQPEDYVDVIVTLDKGDNPVANMTLQDVLVLAINKTSAQNKDGAETAQAKDVKITTVTLAVTPDDATLLALAEVRGAVKLALRPYPPVTAGGTLVAAKTMKSLDGGYAAPVTAPAVAPPAFIPPAAAPAAGTGESKRSRSISVIRGTKVEQVTVY